MQREAICLPLLSRLFRALVLARSPRLREPQGLMTQLQDPMPEPTGLAVEVGPVAGGSRSSWAHNLELRKGRP